MTKLDKFVKLKNVREITPPDFQSMTGEAPFVLKQFLMQPDERTFSGVFDSSFVYSKGYLHHLHRKGYRLPSEPYSEGSALDDLALDILGSFFQSSSGRPFRVVFDYYHSLQLRDFEKERSEELWDLFETLLKGFIHQELSRLKKFFNPQAEILKRRFKDILKQDEYAAKVHAYTEHVHLKSVQPDFTLPVIGYEELSVLVEEAFNRSTSRSEWCRNIFELLGEKSRYCGAIARSDFLRVVVAVNASFLEIPEFAPRSLPDTEQGAIRNAVTAVRTDTMAYVDQQVIGPFVQKRRIIAEDSVRYLAACERFLDDFGHDGDADSIPDYFREVMPEEYHDRYLAEYKYVFETVLQRAREDFAARLKKNPIIRQFGNYWNLVK